jgi:hypothetical protein
MASGTADLQRDLGGAMMQSIFGALLTAGYASAVAKLIAGSPNASQVTDTTQDALTKSFSSATNLAGHYPPQTANAIVAGAKSSFVDGQGWAYTAGVVAVLIGAALVYFLFPKREREEELLKAYEREDSGDQRQAPTPAGQPEGSPVR